MSKRKIQCRVETISEVQKIFEENNNLLLDNLKKFEKELDNMKEVLNTPKSMKIISFFKEYVNQEEKEVLDKGIWFKNIFNNVIDEYQNFESEVSESVGGSNE